MGRKEDNIKKAQSIMTDPKRIRNIGTAAHIDHGKTTLSDNLIAGAGMMSEDLAGKQLMLDFDEQEQARGITINAANASMVHKFEGTEYLINLIDTPGHVDFGGDVTRAMRALDGVIILVCAVEGIMPQTETVIRHTHDRLPTFGVGKERSAPYWRGVIRQLRRSPLPLLAPSPLPHHTSSILPALPNPYAFSTSDMMCIAFLPSLRSGGRPSRTQRAK